MTPNGSNGTASCKWLWISFGMRCFQSLPWSSVSRCRFQAFFYFPSYLRMMIPYFSGELNHLRTNQLRSCWICCHHGAEIPGHCLPPLVGANPSTRGWPAIGRGCHLPHFSQESCCIFLRWCLSFPTTWSTGDVRIPTDQWASPVDTLIC